MLLGTLPLIRPISYLLQGLRARIDKHPRRFSPSIAEPADEVQGRWRDRGVRVLSYDNSDGFVLWSVALSSGVGRSSGRSRRVATHDRNSCAEQATRSSSRLSAVKVAALIRSDRGAKLFADAVPSPPAEWLCVFDRYIRYGSPDQCRVPRARSRHWRSLSLTMIRRVPPAAPWRDDEVDDDPLLSAVRSGARARLGSFGGRQISSITRSTVFTRPLGRPDPERPTAAWWAAGHGTLHEILINQIEWQLGRSDCRIDGRARKLWLLLVESFRHSPFDERWFNFERITQKRWMGRLYAEGIRPYYYTVPRGYLDRMRQNLRIGDWDELRTELRLCP